VAAYRELNPAGEIVAVRSSATAEDLPEASFAGQQETYPNVKGEEAVLEAVQKCWASLWTARATFYRYTQDFDHMHVYLSTVIQKMVFAERSGVAFTINPVTGDSSEIMINAAWGLGEAVVGGRVTPDEYLVDKDTRQIKRKTVASKTTMVVPDFSIGGTAEVEVKEYQDMWTGSALAMKKFFNSWTF